MNKYLYILLIVIVTFIGCDDFFEENLKDESVTLIAPADGLKTSNSSFTFWWDELDGASKYNLQLVSPGFDAIEKVILDTNVTYNKFDFQLYPGVFQWRVKAFNSSYETDYTTYTLTVDSSLNLDDTEVVLLSPDDLSATSASQVNFSWERIYNAEDYNLKIKKDSWDNTNTFESVTTELTNYDVEISEEGIYYWAVRALNDNSSTKFLPREFIVDRTEPNVPSQTSPSHGETISGTVVDFVWERVNDDGSDILETIIIASDSTFIESSILEEDPGQDLFYSASFNVETGKTQKFYWKIKSVDKAGNESEYTDFKRFTVSNEK